MAKSLRHQALEDIPLPIAQESLPGDVAAFLREAHQRIERFQIAARVPAFVQSDFEQAYLVLRAIAAANVSQGNLFCEWGSGFGVVTCLAAMLDFDACGIEIEQDLVDHAQQLAGDFEIPVEFIHGSFIPKGGLDADADFDWLTTQESNHQAETGLAPADFDVIFAYPWPDEEALTETLFARHASAGSVLVTYHSGNDFRIRRKRRTRRNG